MSSTLNNPSSDIASIQINTHIAERLQQIASEEQVSIDKLLEQLLDTYQPPSTKPATITAPQIKKISQEYEFFFDKVLMMVADAIIAINLDEQIIVFNEQAEIVFGYTQQQVIGQPLSILIPELFQSIHHQYVKDFADNERKPRLMATERNEIKGLHKDGHEFFMIASIAHLQFGEQVILTATIRDITEQKQAEKALQEQKQRYDELVSWIPAMVYRVHRTPQGTYHFDYVSPRVRDLNHVEPEDVMRDFSVLHDQTHPEDVPRAVRLQEESARTLNPFIWEGRVIIDGEIRWHHIESRPRRLEDGTIVWDGIKLDITEQKIVKQQARELEIEQENVRILRRFLQAVSHDLRTPITIINTSLYLLKAHLTSEDNQNRLNRIESAVGNLSKIVEKMLKMIELDIVADFKFIRTDLNHLLTWSFDKFEPLAQTQNIDFILEHSSTPLFVNVDQNYITQALNNIVENAIIYTPRDGTVTIRSFQQKHQAIIEIQDTGIGINKDDLPNIFKQFYRVDEARNTSAGSNGLGLAITKKIITVHDGNITVDSIPNVGSTFRIALPMY